MLRREETEQAGKASTIFLRDFLHVSSSVEISVLSKETHIFPVSFPPNNALTIVPPGTPSFHV